MKLVIIDGQSGRMGALIAERVKAAKLPCKVLAVGTNAIATATMMKAGANQMCIRDREKEARKNQHVVEIKEIRMSPGIDVGDFNTKLKNAQKFIADGNRVKVSVRFRGREMAHTDIGRDLLNQFAEQCAEVANMDKSAKLEGRMMSIFLSPKTSK